MGNCRMIYKSRFLLFKSMDNNNLHLNVGHRQFDGGFKDGNKSIHNQGMNFSNTSINGPSLSSFGRQVNEPAATNDHYEGEKSLNSNDKFTNVFNKYTGHGHKDAKLASSAIFPNPH